MPTKQELSEILRAEQQMSSLWMYTVIARETGDSQLVETWTVESEKHEMYLLCPHRACGGVILLKTFTNTETNPRLTVKYLDELHSYYSRNATGEAAWKMADALGKAVVLRNKANALRV